MPRRLILALILLMTAQFVWAAVAPYCAHEESKAAFHVGHHVHKHGAEGQGSTQSAKEVEQERGAHIEHPDCHQCHGSPAQFGAPGMELAAVLTGQFESRVVLQAYRSPFHQDIDRPKWPRAT